MSSISIYGAGLGGFIGSFECSIHNNIVCFHLHKHTSYESHIEYAYPLAYLQKQHPITTTKNGHRDIKLVNDDEVLTCKSHHFVTLPNP